MTEIAAAVRDRARDRWPDAAPEGYEASDRDQDGLFDPFRREVKGDKGGESDGA